MNKFLKVTRTRGIKNKKWHTIMKGIVVFDQDNKYLKILKIEEIRAISIYKVGEIFPLSSYSSSDDIIEELNKEEIDEMFVSLI